MKFTLKHLVIVLRNNMKNLIIVVLILLFAVAGCKADRDVSQDVKEDALAELADIEIDEKSGTVYPKNKV